MPAVLPASAEMPQPWRSETPDEIYCRAVESEKLDNHADAADLYQEAAIRGHLSAMVALGRHLIGLDDRTSVGWFRAAAERGHPTAWTELGHMYARGYGVERSNSHAVACWQRGAMLGDNPAKSCLGLSYIQGFGVEKDPEKGIGIVRQIADAGDVISMRNLAWVYRTGRGVPKNVKEADYWDERASRAGPISNKPLLHPTEPTSSRPVSAPPPTTKNYEPASKAVAPEPESTEVHEQEKEPEHTGETTYSQHVAQKEVPDEHPDEPETLMEPEQLPSAAAPENLQAENLAEKWGMSELARTEKPLQPVAPLPEALDARDSHEQVPTAAAAAVSTFPAAEVSVQGADIPPKNSNVESSRSFIRNLKLVNNDGIEQGASRELPGAPAGEPIEDAEKEPKKPSNSSIASSRQSVQPTVTYLKLVPVSSQQETTYIATETTESVFEESEKPVIAVVKSPMDISVPSSITDNFAQSPVSRQTEDSAGSSALSGRNLDAIIEKKSAEERSTSDRVIATDLELPRTKVSVPGTASPKRTVPHVATPKQGSFWGSPGKGRHPDTASGLEVVDSALTKLKSGSSMESSLGRSSFSSIPHIKVKEIFPKNGSSPSALEGPGFSFQQVVERPVLPRKTRTGESGRSSQGDSVNTISRDFSGSTEVLPGHQEGTPVETGDKAEPVSGQSSSPEDEPAQPKRPSALDLARTAIRHHSIPRKRRSSQSIGEEHEEEEEEEEAENGKTARENDVTEQDRIAEVVKQREPVAAVVAQYEQKEMLAKGAVPPPPPLPPPPRPATESSAPKIPAPPVVLKTGEPNPSVFQKPSGLMHEIESSYSKFPKSPASPESRQAVYDFVDVVQRLRADDKEEGVYLLRRRAWDLVVTSMFAQHEDVCIQERSLHALIRLLRFMPEESKENSVLRNFEDCFTDLGLERFTLPGGIGSGEPGALQGVLLSMRSFPSTRLVQMAGCAAIADLSEVSAECRVSSVDLGAIPQISLSLEQREGNVMSTVYEMASRAVSGICSGPDMVNLKQAMAEQRIIEAIIMGLDRWTSVPNRNDDYLLFATRSGCAALRHVCTSCKESALHAINANVYRSLTRAMNVYMGDAATCTIAIAAIIAISSSLGNIAEESLDDNRVLPTVLTAMQQHSADALLARKGLMCLETLGAYKLLQKRAVEQGTIEATVDIAATHEQDPRVQEQACSTIERLCHYCTLGKDAVAASNGMRTISRAMQLHPSDVGVMERAALGASSTCTNHSVNQNSALQMGIATPIVNALGAHGRQSNKLVIACSTAITALAQAKDPLMGRKMAREEAPEHLVTAMESHMESADVVEHTAYALATLCVADVSLATRLSKLSVEKVILKSFRAHHTTSRCVLAILSAIRAMVSNRNRIRLRFMTDQSAGTGLAQLIHKALAHHMDPFPESNLVVLVCGTLNFLAFECVPHKNEIGRTGIFEQLGEMIQISSRDANVVGLQPSLAALCTLVLNSEENQDRFMNMNGVDMILRLMRKWHQNPKVLEHCCIALRYSCNQHVGNCDDVKRLHGVKNINAVMRSHFNNPRLFEMACLSLAVLCQGDKEIQESPTIAEAIKATCEAMQEFPEDPGVQVAACTLFLSATFENEASKRRVVRYGGRSAIVKALESHPGHLELAEAGAYALLPVENVEVPGVGSPDFEKASDAIQNSGRRDRRGVGLPKTQSQSRLSMSRRKSRDRREVPRSPMHEDREGNGIDEIEPLEGAEELSSRPSRRRSHRESKNGRKSTSETEKKPAGSRSFLRFGSGKRSRAKKKTKPLPVQEEVAREYEAEPEDQEDDSVGHGHHGYSEGYDIYPVDEQDALDGRNGDEENNDEEEDEFDRMHAAHQDRSPLTGSARDYYAID